LQPPSKLERFGEIVLGRHPYCIVERVAVSHRSSRHVGNDHRHSRCDDVAILDHERYGGASERYQHVRWRFRIFLRQIAYRAVDVRLTWKSLQVHVVDENVEGLAGFFAQPLLESANGAYRRGLRGRQAFQKIDAAPMLGA